MQKLSVYKKVLVVIAPNCNCSAMQIYTKLPVTKVKSV